LMALEYPRPNGFVNDFANQLPPEAVESLERKLRDYHRATGDTIRVAVVSMPDGMSIDEYSEGMFRAWGGAAVLFVWAPSERQIRLQVGRRFDPVLTASQAVLTDSQATHVVSKVTPLFRDQRYKEGVNAAVDEVIGMMGPAAAVPATRFVGSHAPLSKRAGGRVLVIGFGVMAASGLGLWFIARQRRVGRWRNELHRITASGNSALTGVELKCADASAALQGLRGESPKDVWRGFETRVDNAMSVLDRHRRTLAKLRLMPCGTYAEAKIRHEEWLCWKQTMDAMRSGLQEVRSTLDTFRACRAKAQRMLVELPPILTRMEARGVPPWAAPLLPAATRTYDDAQREIVSSPTNWLLVHDRLADVRECLKQIESPSRAQYKPVRCWTGAFASPAATALDSTYGARVEALKAVSAASRRESDGNSWGDGEFDSYSDGGYDSGGSDGASAGY